MKCEDFRELISLYIDDELDEANKNELIKHLENCPLCRKEYEELKALKEMLGKIGDEELPENFHNELMAKIKPAKEKTKKKKFVWSRYSSLAASICAVLLVGGALVGMDAAGMKASSADAASPEMFSTNSVMMDMSADQNGSAELEDIVFESESAAEEYKLSSATVALSEGDSLARNAQSELKIIKTGNLDITVKNYDESVEHIKNEIETRGGYVESFSSYVYSNRWVNGEQISLREGNLTLKVPSDQYEETFETLKTYGEVVNENESSKDVTESYVDTESRMLVKKTEEERLVELLAKAENVEDIISIEGRLSEVRGEIESYEARLKDWDRNVSYSIISLFITENPDEAVEPVSPDLGTRIKKSFVRGINSFIWTIEDLIVTFAGNVFAIAVVAVVVVIVVAVVKKTAKKRTKKDEEDNE